MNKSNIAAEQDGVSNQFLTKTSSSGSSCSSSASYSSNSNQKNHYNNNNQNGHPNNQNSRYKGQNYNNHHQSYNNSSNYNKDYTRPRNNKNANFNTNMNNHNSNSRNNLHQNRNSNNYNYNQKSFNNSKKNEENNFRSNNNSNKNDSCESSKSNQRNERDMNSNNKAKLYQQKTKDQSLFNKKSNNNSNNKGYNGFNHNHNYQFQAAPFQPTSYHQNNSFNQNINQKNYNNINNHHNHHNNHHNHHNQSNVHVPKQFNNSITNQNHKQYKFMIDKYNTKYNLISFILLRKNDEYLADYKYYFNDQSLYQKVDSFIEKRLLEPLKSIFSLKENLADFTNSYNCNLFVYAIRKCLESESQLKLSGKKEIKLVKILDENNNETYVEEKPEDDNFAANLISMLFSKDCCPKNFFHIDGDFPRRNVMHYAANYNCSLISELILKSEINRNKNLNNSNEFSETNDIEMEVSRQVLTEITNKICEEFKEKDSPFRLDFQGNTELILLQLCSQTDFNGNTPIHLAAMNDSYDLLKMINPLCIRYSQFVYNEDGLNPFLLACRHSSVEFIKHLVEQQRFDCSDQFLENTTLDLLQCRDKINFKNCLHYACGRGCGKAALKTIRYLTNLAVNQTNTETSLNQLIGAISPLIGSVHHAAASNLTRLSTLWYLLSLYPKKGILVNNESILNSLDFRDFTCVDCLFDAVMNLREMAHPDCKYLKDFYNELLGQNQTLVKNTESDFQILLNRCVYKLSIEYHASFYNLPRIKNQWQLLEFLKILVFMSKFYTEKKNLNYLNDVDATSEYSKPNTKGKSSSESESTYNKIYGQNFELFCINFLKKFITGGDVLPSVFTGDTESIEIPQSTKNAGKNSEDKKSSKNAQKNPDEVYVLTEIMNQLYEFVSICSISRSISYSLRFRVKIKSHLETYLKNLETYLMNKNTLFLAKLTNLTSSASESLPNSPCSSKTSEDSNDLIHFVNKQLERSTILDEYSECLLQEENVKVTESRSRLNEIKSKTNALNEHNNSVFNLKNLCREVINAHIIKSSTSLSLNHRNNNECEFSILSRSHALFKLPVRYANLVNFLSYNLIDDLYGTDFDVKSQLCVN